MDFEEAVGVAMGYSIEELGDMSFSPRVSDVYTVVSHEDANKLYDEAIR